MGLFFIKAVPAQNIKSLLIPSERFWPFFNLFPCEKAASHRKKSAEPGRFYCRGTQPFCAPAKCGLLLRAAVPLHPGAKCFIPRLTFSVGTVFPCRERSAFPGIPVMKCRSFPAHTAGFISALPLSASLTFRRIVTILRQSKTITYIGWHAVCDIGAFSVQGRCMTKAMRCEKL